MGTASRVDIAGEGHAREGSPVPGPEESWALGCLLAPLSASQPQRQQPAGEQQCGGGLWDECQLDRACGKLFRDRAGRIPTIEQLVPAVKAKLADLRGTLECDAAQGRMALRALLGEDRLRIYADSRIGARRGSSPK